MSAKLETSGYSSSSSAMNPNLVPTGGQRSTICAVCKVDTNSFHQNYGANTCLSCRAFFRRNIQQNKMSKWKCKGGGAAKCQITLETRKRCKKCRFEACVEAGMNAEAVLDEDQFKKRFRKMIRKQKKTTSTNGHSNDDDQDEQMVSKRFFTLCPL